MTTKPRPLGKNGRLVVIVWAGCLWAVMDDGERRVLDGELVTLVSRHLDCATDKLFDIGFMHADELQTEVRH